LKLFKEMKDSENEEIVWVFFHLGRVLFAQGHEVQAYAHVEEGLAFSRKTNYAMAEGCGLYLLGRFALARGDVSRAEVWLEESLSLFRDLRETRHIAHVLSYRARLALLQGNETEARALCEESVALFRQVDDSEGIMYCLQGFGGMVARQDQPLWAARLWGAAERFYHVSEPRLPLLLPIERTQVERADYEVMVKAVRAELGERAFNQAFAEGQAMTPEQAIQSQDHPLSSR
jgi:tetratricopeptide (TPR) repeat protein